MSDDIRNKKKKELPSDPPSLIYRICTGLFGLYLKIVRGLKVDRSDIRELSAPYVVISNHQSMVDFGAVAYCCLPNRINFVVSSHFFHSPSLSKLLPFAGCIKRRQFVPDLLSIRQMQRAIKRGNCVGIFPEGQTCINGQNNEISQSIGQLIKVLKVPVVNAKIRGNYLAMPKWSTSTFPGKAEVTASLLLTAQQVQDMSADEIADIIIDAVSYNEYEWQEKAKVKSKVKRSPKGLDKYLFKCPNCGKEFTISSDDDYLHCSCCGIKVKMDEYGFLSCDTASVPSTPADWMNWQKQQLQQQLDAGTLLPVVTKIRFMESAVGEYEESGYNHTGDGTVVLNEEGMTYTGTRNGEPFEYHVSPKVQWNLTHNAALCAMDICWDSAEDRDFAFDPEDYHMMIKIIQIWPLIRKKYFE